MVSVLLAALSCPLLAGAWQQRPGTAVSPEPGSAAAAADEQARDRARAYYHFTLAHVYEELAGPFRRSDFLRRAVDEYKEALKYDPDSTEIIVQLAEAYRRSGSIRQAVVEARQLLKADADNLAAHRLLGRIYFQTLGEMEPGPPPETLKLAIEEYEQVARLAPADTASLQTLAGLYRMDNDLARAEATLKKLLEVEPRSDTALAALASLYTDQGEDQKAIELLEGAAAGTHSSSVLGSLAYAYEQEGDFDHAVETYRRALQHDEGNMGLRRRLAESLLRLNRPEQAEAEYRAIVESEPDDAQSQLRLSQIYRHQNRYPEARAALEKAKEVAPDNLEIGFNEALLDEAEGEFDAAIAVLSEMATRMTRGSGEYSAEEKRSRSLVLERLGALYRRIQDFDEAATVFNQLLSLGEEPARRGYSQIAETLRQARRLDEAIASMRQARERFPDDKDLDLQIAALLGENGDVEGAVALLDPLLTGSPQDRPVYLTLAQIYERNKRYPEAEDAVAQAEEVSSSPSEREFVYFMRGALYERQKMYERAEEQFRQVLELNPESAVTLNYLGYMFADQGMKLEEAVELIQRALQLDPYNGAYLDSLGWAYFRLQQFGQAEEFLLKAVKRLSNDPTIHDHLGDVYYELGRLHLAVKAWERSRQEWQRTPATGVDPEALAKLEEKLRRLKLRLARETKQKPQK
ncbi:MAG: tetratricopeptide repeat protein [Terriglobia bacterium]